VFKDGQSFASVISSTGNAFSARAHAPYAAYNNITIYNNISSSHTISPYCNIHPHHTSCLKLNPFRLIRK